MITLILNVSERQNCAGEDLFGHTVHQNLFLMFKNISNFPKSNFSVSVLIFAS